MACGAIPEPFPVLDAELRPHVADGGKNQRGLRGFLKNNTASQLVWQEIVDFSS
jgi:hypothetical protein